ncbi:nucleoside 2-deoxyribosyltransferase [Xanthomonas campestris]|uniref:Nucleoside 2-deoxyribosyltransferase n=1 Tax=Xanthomonas campestris pv. papavericola TaxID=487881 RepID=A0AAJ3CCZ3_XANCA|nr:nucleoside 2-deoxyribosyltransferase [Xanthomonas campestris]MEC3887418.1 nucleoside 2-deoxyribosyltransferase [Xanthomonas campestris pv. papavericola]
MARKAVKKVAKKIVRKVAKGTKVSPKETGSLLARFPRHAVGKCIRIAKAIFEQNAGHPCTPAEAAAFVGVGLNGPFNVEISSASKFGLLERPTTGQIQPTQLAKKIIRPQSPGDEVDGYREAVLKAPEISEVYKHYRGENLPDDQFFKNTVVETYKVPSDNFLEFKQIFLDSLESAQLINRHGDKIRIVDASDEDAPSTVPSERIKKLGKAANVGANDTCFVMQPFAAPLGDYYEKIYKPAIEKAGLKPVRADADIFGTGKIMDQVWDGIRAAKVLVAELTTRNPNVFYELGLAHALEKPVVLVSSREDDVPFDLQHIRVIYYDSTDPFWGVKLIEKVAENVLSAINNPKEAIFKSREE